MYEPTPYKIIEIKEYTEDIKLFRIKCDLNPLPGQFFEVSIPGIGECPLASCSYNKEYVDLLIKKVGNVTSAMFQCKIGDTIYIRGNYGNGWPIKKLIGKNLILIAGGTGLAPITSMIEYIEQNRKQFKNIKIYFGFRNENYILLKERIKKWKAKFDLTITLDRENSVYNPACFNSQIHNLNFLSVKNSKTLGILTPSSLHNKISKQEEFICQTGFIHELLAKDKLLINDTIALMCGPEIMMQCSTDKLISQGLKSNKIYWSTERRMECGFGSCGRCQIQDLYCCKDGPIFRYDIIKPKLDNEESANKKEEESNRQGEII